MTDHAFWIIIITLAVLCIVLLIPDAANSAYKRRYHAELDKQIAELEELIRERNRGASDEPKK